MSCTKYGLALCGLVFLAAGCGQANSGKLPPTYKVTGVVKSGGEPLANAVVQFQLVEGNRGAVGQTDQSGRYQLTTFRPDDGAIPGEYRVAILKMSEPPADFPVRQSEDDPNVPQFVPKNLLPEKYAQAEVSGLTATVAEQANQIDFELE